MVTRFILNRTKNKKYAVLCDKLQSIIRYLFANYFCFEFKTSNVPISTDGFASGFIHFKSFAMFSGVITTHPELGLGESP